MKNQKKPKSRTLSSLVSIPHQPISQAQKLAEALNDLEKGKGTPYGMKKH